MNYLDVSELGFQLMELREGSASLVVPKVLDKTSRYAPSRSTVFYNPRMALNRDIAVVFLKTLSKRSDGGLTVCEPLGGCGVRAVRIALGVNGIERVVVNDINSRAVKLIQLNVKKAGVLNQVEIHNDDANVFLSSFTKPGNRADYIDIDPFGSPSAYIESGLMALRNNGVLVLTATDMAPLCGVHSKACVRRYGAKPLRVEYCHELAVRILIGRTVIAAARRDLAVEPLLSHSTDHYIRVYLKIKRGARKADCSLNDMGYITHCFNCLHRSPAIGLFPRLDEHCVECRSAIDFAGPLWLGNLWNHDILSEMVLEVNDCNLSEKKRVKTIIEKILCEIKSPPTYYVLSHLCDHFNLQVPKLSKFIQNVKDLGYSLSLTHFHPHGIKTDAPVKVLRKILEELSSN